MNLFSFTEQFPTEEACRLHFKAQRDKQGVICPKCGHQHHYWVQSKWSYQCKKCKCRTSLRSGTVMQSSKLPFLVWYQCMFLLSATKKGFSAKEMQRQLGLKRYEPVWAMVHKLRKAMGERDRHYTLGGGVEFDEGCFAVEASEKEKVEGGRGRGSASKRTVAVMAESTPLEDPETGKESRQCRYFKAKLLNDHKAETAEAAVKEAVAKDATLFTDKSSSYVNFADLVEVHVSRKSGKETTEEHLKWAHILIANAKRTFLGNYHKISGKYLQNYLDEFVYKLNRRYFGARLFDRPIIANITGLTVYG